MSADLGLSGDRVVVVIATVDTGTMRELTRERYTASSVGEALDAHAPDPAPGARFEVEYVGRARSVGAEGDLTPWGQSGVSQ